MKGSFISKIVDAGLQHELPEYLQRKVRPTNAIALLLAFLIAIPFAIISYINFPQLTIVPSLGVMATVVLITANYFGYIDLARVISSVFPTFLGAIYNALLCGPADEPILGVYMTEFSFALIPFVLFDLREKGLLSLTSGINMLLIFSFPVTKEWFTIEADVTILRQGWLAGITIFLSLISAFGTVLGLAYLNQKSEKHSEDLVKIMDEKNKVLESSSVELQENLKKLEVAQIEEQKRNWATEGIAKISDIIRTNRNASEMYDKIIAELVKYVKANQGGLYIVDENEQEKSQSTIKLSSCYAYSRKKFVDHECRPGQGLLGQAYLEKDYIFLTEIPDDYVRITSGLGDATPTSLLIMPLKVNEVVEGLIEIAAFHKFEPHEIKFIEKLGENIASFIQSNRINERTNRLLEETLHQAEEMRAQEEEFRQNMEELAATQEEMHRKESEYLNKIKELEERLQAETEMNSH